MADLTAVTQIEITGKDSTGPVFGDVKAGLNKIEDAAGELRGMLGNLAGVISVGMFASAIKEAIDYADNLNDLSKQTGISVETLGGLGYAAKQSGVDLETVAKGGQKLAGLLADAASGSEKAATTLQDMGISLKSVDGSLTSVDEALLQAADKFAGLSDGTEKAALAQAGFGEKIGARLIPLLNEGGEKLRAMIAEYVQYGGVTTETAERADAFNDTLAKLEMVGGALMQELASALLPTLQAIADVFVDVKVQGEGFAGIANVLVTVVKSIGVAAVGVVAVFDTLGKGLGALAAAAVQLAQGNFKAAWSALKEGGSDAAATVSTAIERATKIWDSSTAEIATKTETATVKTKASLGRVNDELKKQRDELDKLQAKWDQFDAAQDAGLAPQTIKDLEELDRLLAANRIGFERYVELMGKVLDKDPILAKEQQEINKAYAEMAKWLAKVDEERTKELDKLDQEIAKQKQANATFGLGKVALIDLQIAELERIKAMEMAVGWDEKRIAFLDAQIEKMRTLKGELRISEELQQQQKDLEASQKHWADTFKSIDDFARATFTGLFDDTASTWENMWNTMKSVALNILYELAAKPLVIQIVAAAGGAVGLNGLANAALGAGGIQGGSPITGLLGNLLGGGNSLLGFGGLSGLLSGAGGIFGAGAIGNSFALSGLGQALGLSAAGLEAGGGVALTSFGTALGAALPIAGVAAALAPLILSAFDSKGGPKEGGWATTGAVPGITGVDSTGRWFTPTGADAQMVDAVTGLNATFEQLLTALGGTGAAVFAQGFSTDPKGNAPSNVHTGAWVNGQQVFDNPNGNVGRSQEELAAELETQSMRAILAALQASDLPDVVAGYLQSIDVATATVEEIKAALAHAAELKVLVDAVAALPKDMADGLLAALGVDPELDQKIATFAAEFKAFSASAERLNEVLAVDPQAAALKAVADAQETHYGKVLKLRDGLQETLAAYDGTAAGTDKLTAATAAYVNAQIEALIQIEQLKTGLAGMFAESIHQLDWAIMDNAQRGAFLMDEAAKTIELLKQTTDPTEIEKFASLINEDLVAAFNLLSPEEQKAQHDAFVEQLKTADELVQAQLEASRQEIAQDNANAQTVLGSIRAAMDVAAEKQQAAAQALIDAAKVIQDAAQKQVDAAAAAEAASSKNAAAAAVQAQAAETALEAAQTPVNVTVQYDPALSGP